MMHPKAAYLALRGCIPMRYCAPSMHYRIVLGGRCLMKNKGDLRWCAYAASVSVYEPMAWDEVLHEHWEALPWVLIHDFLED